MLSGLPAEYQALMREALGTLPAGKREAALVHAEALSSSRRKQLVEALQKALAPLDREERAALVDGLVGASGAAQQQALAERQAAKSKALEEVEAALPAQVGLEPAAEAFVAHVIAMQDPHLRSLLEEALARLPAERRAIVLAQDIVAAEQSLHEAGAEKAVKNIEWILGFQDAEVHAFIEQAGYEGGTECVDGCPTELAEVRILVDDIPALPELIQHDVADCIYTPICTAAERRGIEEYAAEQAQAGRRTYDTTTILGAFMQFDSEVASESWIEAFA